MEYFIKYQKVIEKLAADDAQCVKKHLMLSDRSVVNELTFISTHLLFLVEIIKKLETQSMLLSESYCLISELQFKKKTFLNPKGQH